MIKDYVLGFVFDLMKKEVLLIQKIKPDWQKGFLNGVGGKVESDKDQTLADAMSREFEEEANAKIPAMAWTHYCTMRGRNCPDGDWNVYCYYFILNSKLQGVRHEIMRKESEILLWVHLGKVRTVERGDSRLLGNIPWLTGMALDHYINTNFIPVDVMYTGGFSLPLNLEPTSL